MSSRLVKKCKRVYKVAFTSWSGGILTVTTTSPHYLVANDQIYIQFNNVPQLLTGSVSNTGTVGTSIQFQIPCPNDYGIGPDALVNIEYFTPGLAASTVNGGVLPVMTNSSTAHGETVVQGILAASGSATFKLQGSLDGINFVDTGSTVTISAATSGFATISPRWVYIRPVVTVTATQNLTILMSA